MSLFQSGQDGYFLELELHFADDGGGGIGIDIGSTAVESSLDVGHREVWEDIGQMLGETSLGAVGTEEAQTDKGIAQVGPLPACIGAGFGVALLDCSERTPDVEATVVEGFIELLNGGFVGRKLGTVELGQKENRGTGCCLTAIAGELFPYLFLLTVPTGVVTLFCSSTLLMFLVLSLLAVAERHCYWLHLSPPLSASSLGHRMAVL